MACGRVLKREKSWPSLSVPRSDIGEGGSRADQNLVGGTRDREGAWVQAARMWLSQCAEDVRVRWRVLERF